MSWVEVFYTDKKNGWAVAFINEYGHQIGEARFYYKKNDAELDAVGHGLPVRIYNKNGRLRKILEVK
jgi:hypothetical protein